MAVRLNVFRPDGTSEVVECLGIPNDVFKPLVESGSDWIIDLSQADENETRRWRHSHIQWRVSRALKTHKSVMWSSGKSITDQQEVSRLFLKKGPGSVHFSETDEAVYLTIIL